MARSFVKETSFAKSLVKNGETLPKTLGWDIVERPVLLQGETDPIPGYSALTRSDSGSTLNIVKESYKHVPNAVLRDTVDQLADISGFKLAGFDEFKGGRLLIAYLAITKPFEIAGFKFHEYLTVGNSHDGSTQFFIGTSNRMLRCSNDFGAITESMQVRHTRNSGYQIGQLVKHFKSFMNYREDFADTMNEMREINIDADLTASLVELLVNAEKSEILGDRKEINKVRLRSIEALESSIKRETDDLGMNLFGLFNGVTHWTTHERKQADRIYGAMNGAGFRLNNFALDWCIDVLDQQKPLTAEQIETRTERARSIAVETQDRDTATETETEQVTDVDAIGEAVAAATAPKKAGKKAKAKPAAAADEPETRTGATGTRLGDGDTVDLSAFSQN